MNVLNEKRLLLVISHWTWLAAAAVTSILVVIFIATLQMRAEPHVATVHLVPKPGTAAERRQAFAHLVKNPDVAQRVLARVGPTFPEDLRSAESLLAVVQGSLPPRSDLVALQVRVKDRELARRLAMEWATDYASYVNRLYGDTFSGGRDVEADAQAARQRYDQAQAAYVAALEASPMGEHERALAAIEDLIKDLRAAIRADVARGLVRGTASPHPLEPLVGRYEEEARDLRGAVAREQGTLRLLENERDAAQATYVELVKQVNQRLAAPAQPPELVLATQTAVADVAVPRVRSLALLVPLAGMLGGAAAGIAIILWDVVATAYAQVSILTTRGPTGPSPQEGAAA